MSARRFLLSGATAAALLGVFAAGVPARAQSGINGPQYSTPAERAETQQLNQESLGGTTQSPAVLNGEMRTNVQWNPQDSREYNEQMEQYQGEQNQPRNDEYHQQMDRYQDQQQIYQHQRAQYERQQNNYYHNVRWYDQARWNYEDYPHAYGYDYDGRGVVRLSEISAPSDALVDVPIEGPNGDWVGKIRAVSLGPDGQPVRVEVALNRRVALWLDPGDLRFDPDEHVAFTDLTRTELWHMPGTEISHQMM